MYSCHAGHGFRGEEWYTLCFVISGNNLLVLNRRYPPYVGRWNCPGGKVRLGETPLEACIREVYEETGLQITEPRLRAVVELTSPNRTAVLYTFVANQFVGGLKESREGPVDWLPIRYLDKEPDLVPDIPILFRMISACGEDIIRLQLRRESTSTSPDSHVRCLGPTEKYFEHEMDCRHVFRLLG